MATPLFYLKKMRIGFFFILILAVTGCQKAHVFENVVPALPVETHVGKNTFGFNLNGQLWLPASKGPDGGPALSSYIQNNSFTLAANRLNQHITFNVPQVVSTGSYDLTASVNTAIFINDTARYTCTEGVMKVTYFDGQKGIISGVFSMKAISGTGDVVSIDEGRFDTTF
jgi:hypothetical protein